MADELTRQYLDEKFDDFAKIVADGFAGVDRRFDGVDRRFEGVDRRLDEVDRRLDGVDRRLEGVDRRFDGIEQRLDRVEYKVIDVDAKQDELIKKVSHLEDQHSQIFNKIDGFLVLIQRHEAEIAALRSAYQRLDERLQKLEMRFA